VHKGSTQTNKKVKLGFKKKGAKEIEVYPGLTHRTVRCTRPYNSKLFSFEFLRRRSAIIHRTVRCTSGATDSQRNGRLQRYSAWTVRAEVRAAARGALDNARYLSGATPDCPVPPEDKAPTIETVRTLTVGWRGWRTGLSSAPIDSSLPQRLNWWLGAINTPQPPPLQPSKHSQQCI
jgi:hypothetical protein